jgi:hypothetical protein
MVQQFAETMALLEHVINTPCFCVFITVKTSYLFFKRTPINYMAVNEHLP